MKQSLTSDAVKLTTSKIITMIIALVNSTLLSHFRTLEEFGTYSQLLLVINLVTTIFMLGLPNSINYFLAKLEKVEEKQNFLSSYYTVSTILSIITGLILILCVPFIEDYFNNPNIKDFIYVLAIFPWANIILSSIENILIVFRKTKQLMLFKIYNSIFILVIIILMKLLSLSFQVYMCLFISIEAVFAISVYFIAANVCGKISIYFNKEIISNILKFSIPIGLASIVGVLSIELDKLVIGKFFSTEQIAIYSNAAREMPVTIIASSITAVLMPHLVNLLNKNKYQEAIQLWGSTIIVSYIIICFFAVGLFVYAKEVISLLYSTKYLPGITVFRIFNIVLLLRFTYFGIILNSIGKTKLILYSSLASLGLNLVLNYSFYLYFGFIGPAIATLISILLVALFQIVKTSQILKVSFSEIFPWSDLFIITVINVSLGVAFAYLKIVLPLEKFTGDILESIILSIFWGLIYYITMFRKIINNWLILNRYN